ncbi:FAD-binding oxidoreductase [Heyndrickxia coagulans]|uniref:FAD-binding oxidoreductase n=1 Tax=Heyndrickxia coagulans TaxID=1398 RepID=UPI0004014C43|nr:FAD-linked oxidase C-terminal domain-containing protein [Heyndrickxia coagulans]
MENFILKLKELIGPDLVSGNETILEQHSRDESYHTPHLPQAVVFPESVEQVREVVAFANENHIPVIPFGLGSSLEGHVIPYQGGITLDMMRMNKVVEVLDRDFIVRVQPGVTRTQLNRDLKKYGLFFPVDPGADATLGGMAATNASGTTSVKYGVMRDQVYDLEVVLADGTVIHTGSLAAKSSSGYHLNGLMVGSEGTLGVITELALKVYGRPEEMVAARAVFETVRQAVDAVVAIRQAGIPMERMELVDKRSLQQANRFMGTMYPEWPTLFLEFTGNESGLKQDVNFAKDILAEFQCKNVVFEKDEKARHKLWDARHKLAYAFVRGTPGKKMMVTDACVPLHFLPEAIEDTRKTLDRMGMDGAIVGHVGDGNYHVILMIDMGNENEIRQAQALNEHIVSFALSKGGTCTGEHGVGIGKAKYQREEHGPAYGTMKKIKDLFDPNHILNPGKIFI